MAIGRLVDVRHEFLMNGSWEDVTGFVRGDTQITRGRGAENDAAPASKCTFTLDNRTGDFSPLNPEGSWYGYFRSQVQHRCSVVGVDGYLVLNGDPGDTASTPDSAALSLTGDLEFSIDLWLPNWRLETVLASKWVSSGDQRSFAFQVNVDGTLQLDWTSAGTSGTQHTLVSNAVVPFQSGRFSVRWTLDADNGSGGSTGTFYYRTSPGLDGSWTQLGGAVTGTTASIYDGTAPLALGDTDDQGRFEGRVFEAQLLNGLGGSSVADPDFTGLAEGTTSFSDTAGNTWTVGGPSGKISDRDFRFHGRISEPQLEWDESGVDSTVRVTSYGPLQRLSQGRRQKPLKSAYRRGATSRVAPMGSLKAYWPLEDPSGSSRMASGVSRGLPMSISGAPDLASDSEGFIASEALPTLTSGSAFGGSVRPYAATNDIQVLWLLKTPDSGVTSTTRVLGLRCSGSAPSWDVQIDTAGHLRVFGYDVSGATVFSTCGSMLTIANGKSVRLGLHLAVSGANTTVTISAVVQGDYFSNQGSGTCYSHVVGGARWVAIAPDKGLDGCTVGHVTVQSTVTAASTYWQMLAANTGANEWETACERLARLCDEEELRLRTLGDQTTSQSMGAQTPETLLTLLRECEDTDGGVLSDPRDQLGLLYRSRRSLESQPTVLSLDYSSADLSPAYQPVGPGQYTMNRLELTRKGGTTYVYENTSSSAEPEDGGVGLYEKTLTLSLSEDDQLPDQCHWRVHLGTDVHDRFPGIKVEMGRKTFQEDLDLFRAATLLDVGDRLSITGPPQAHAPDTQEQLVIGTSETISRFSRKIVFVGIPEIPYRTPIFGVSRVDSEGSTLNGAHNASTTTLSVSVSEGQIWTHTDGDFDIIVGGERMTVTAVAGSSSPQTLTVTRSVNGITKSHQSGAEVHLFSQTYVGLEGPLTWL